MGKAAARRADYQEMDRGRLLDELAGLKKEEFNLRFQQATGQLEKPHIIRENRRNIARVKTALRVLALNGDDSPSPAGRGAAAKKRASGSPDPHIRGERNPSGSGTSGDITSFDQDSVEWRSELTDGQPSETNIDEPLNRRLLGEIIDMVQEEYRDALANLLEGDSFELSADMEEALTASQPPSELADADVNMARHAISLIMPALTSGSLSRAKQAAHVLAWLAGFEPDLGTDRISSPSDRLSRLLESYNVPCFIDIDIVEKDGGAAFVIHGANSLQLDSGDVVRLPQQRGRVEIYVSDAERRSPRRVGAIPLADAAEFEESVPFESDDGDGNPATVTLYYNGMQLAERTAEAEAA